MTTFEWLNVTFNIVVSLGVAFAFYEFFANKKFNRELAAKSAHLDYVKLSIENPLLANPNLIDIDYSTQKINGKREEFEKYEWYVSFMITSFEELLLLSDSESWMNSARSNIITHKDYITSEFFKEMGYRNNIDPKLWEIIVDIFPELQIAER